MTALPVVARELKVRAAHAGFHWVRAALAGFAVLACFQSFNFNFSMAGPATTGTGLFHSLAWLGFVLAVVASIVTADCVSGERRDGTLGLLFLTTLKSKDVVLGKFAASGLVALYTLLGFAPVLMLPLFLGGVTGGEVARTALTLMNLMFVALATGLWVSAFSRTHVAAVLGAFALLALLTLAPFFADMAARSFITFRIATLSPLFDFFQARDVQYSAAPLTFWLSLGEAHAEGWLLLAAAGFGLRRNWREIFQPRARAVAEPESRRLMSPPRVVVARGNRRRVFAPVARAVLRMNGLRELAWFGAFISLIGSVCSAFAMKRWGSMWDSAGLTSVFSFVTSGLFALVTGRFFFETRRSGELELLLVTPVGAKGILREQQLALLRMLRGPFYLAVVGSIAAAASSLSVFEGNLLGLVPSLCIVANTALGLVAVGLVGMWFGSRAKSPFSLIGWSVGLVEVIPFALAYLAPFLFFNSKGATLFRLWVLAVPVLFVSKNILFILWARQQLRREFRAQDITFNWFHRESVASPAELPHHAAQPSP